MRPINRYWSNNNYKQITKHNQIKLTTLKSAIKTILNNTRFQPCSFQKTIAPLIFSIITKSNKGSKDVYNFLQVNKATKAMRNAIKQLSYSECNLIYKSCFKTVQSSYIYLIYLQFKIIDHILPSGHANMFGYCYSR